MRYSFEIIYELIQSVTSACWSWSQVTLAKSTEHRHVIDHTLNKQGE